MNKFDVSALLDAHDLNYEDLLSLEVDWQLGGIADPVGQIANWIVSTLSQVIYAAEPAIANLINPVITGVQNFLKGLLDAVASNVSSIWSALQTLPQALSNVLSQLGSEISRSLTSFGSSIALSISSISGSISSTLNSILTTLSTAIGNLATTIIHDVQGAVSGIGTALTNLGSAIVTDLSRVIGGIGSVISQALQGVGQYFAGVGAQIIAAVDQSFKNIGSTFGNFQTLITTALQPLIKFDWSSLTKQLSGFANFLFAFGSDPIGTIKKGLNEVLKDLGLPTLDDIQKIIPSLDSIKKAMFDEIDLGLISSFLTSAKSFFDVGQKHHSPQTGFDDFWNSWAEILGAMKWINAGNLGKINFFANTTAKDATNFWQELENFLQDFGKKVVPKLKGFIGTLEGDLLDVIDYMLTGVGSAFGLKVMDKVELQPITTLDGKKHDDPFQIVGSMIFNKFYSMIGDLKSTSPITQDQFVTVLEGSLAGLAVAESAEFLGLGVDIIHPMKNLQLRQKMKDINRKLHLDRVPSLTLSLLLAQTFEPILRRFYNKLAQLQLPDSTMILNFRDYGIIGESEADEYIQEHGLNKTFRTGVQELHYQRPTLEGFRNAMLRYVAFEAFDRAKFETEFKQLLKIHALKPDPRTIGKFQFSKSDQDLANISLYALPSFRELRLMGQTGDLDPALVKEIYVAGGLDPDYIDQLSKAIVTFGVNAERGTVRTNALARYTKGFSIIDTLKTALKKALYGDAAINYLQQGGDIAISNTVSTEQLKDADEDYEQGFIDKSAYGPRVEKLILNADLKKAHLDLADNARARYDRNLVRAAANAVILQVYADLSQGANTESEFRSIASQFNKTKAEQDALVKSAKLSLQAKIRTANFRTLQTQLAKLQLTPQEFEAGCQKQSIDQDLYKAAEIRILTQLLPKPKAAAVQAVLQALQTPAATAPTVPS
jgi:hypothetical protein